jgi:hypothetical protein
MGVEQNIYIEYLHLCKTMNIDDLCVLNVCNFVIALYKTAEAVANVICCRLQRRFSTFKGSG